MPRDTSPYIFGDCWLDKRRDGRSPDIWQIATAVKRSVVYRSTHKRGLDEAKAAIEAHVAQKKALERHEAREAEIIPVLMTYWLEKGRKAINFDQTGRSLRTFIGFLMHDRVGVRAVVTDLTPALFERFREWRMKPHQFTVPWAGAVHLYSSGGVAGATVQRNVNDIRAAIHHAAANMRITMAPRIGDIDPRYQSPLRERVLTMDEMARIAWYASHNPDLFRFVTLQFATAARPLAAMKFDARVQYIDATGLIDLQPGASPQTKKRNAIVPAIRPMRPVLRAWVKANRPMANSRKTAWRNMRRVLGLSDDVFPKTIRHTVATLLYADETVPEREIVELMGHDGKLARTTRVYAKYDPNRLRNVCRVLATIWLQISREARAFDADHLLTTGQRGEPFEVRFKPENIRKSTG